MLGSHSGGDENSGLLRSDAISSGIYWGWEEVCCPNLQGLAIQERISYELY